MSFRWSQGAVSLHSTLPWAVGSLPLRGASLTLTTFPPFLLTVGYMRLCPCGLDPQSHTISHATRCVPTLIAGSCWVGHGGAHAFFRYIPLSVETLRATSQFGYVRDACNVSFGYVRDACNVSVWIVSGYVGDVARYVSTGWWNRGMGRFPPIHPDRCYVYIL